MIFLYDENKKSLISRKRCEIERFGPNFWLGGYNKVVCFFLTEIVSPPFLAVILNVCVKRKTAYFEKFWPGR